MNTRVYFNTEKYREYCDKVANTNDWGGQLELQALSAALKVPISIFTADSSTLEMGEEYKPIPPLKLSYHRHAYSLGAHYNSVVPFVKSNDSDNETE